MNCLDFSNKKNCLLGDERTDKQKQPSKNLAKIMKGRSPPNKDKPAAKIYM